MKIGFTGTQEGMTTEQFDTVAELLREFEAHEIHHGDCVGADDHFHQIVEFLNSGTTMPWLMEIHIHPPIIIAKRKFLKGHVMHGTKDYLARNKDIVDASDVLIACPKEEDEQRRSGTWSTWRYAKKQGKKIYLITPNGVIE